MRGFKSSSWLFSISLASTIMAATVLLFILAAAGPASAAPGSPPVPITLQMHSIPSPIPGVNLSLREKHMTGRNNYKSDRIVLLLEPFGVPAAEAFDANIPGGNYSLMDYLAQRGYDVWALDFRGFGGSDRSAAFNQPMMANPPQMRAADTVLDVDAAMQYISSQQGVSRTHLLGWSWGAVVASQYAGEHPDRVERLVIDGGMHAFLLPSMTQPMDDPNNPGHMKTLPAYQLAVPSMSINHWNMQAMGMVPHTPEAEAELSRIFLASDPTSGTRTPPSIRRAMGPMVDLYEIWSGRPVFDASLITAPTLIIRGDHDTFSDDPGFMSSLTSAPVKRYVEIPLATHWALYEPLGAPVLMSEIGRFLSCGRPSFTLNKNNVQWASYPDYQSGLLSVDFSVSNAGADAGYSLRITGSSTGNGVGLVSPVPLTLGDIPGAASTIFTLKYQVPSGVSCFRTTLNATAEDGGGIQYPYPGSPAA